MERKELESETIGSWDGDIAEYTDFHNYYLKEEADAVMDAMEFENCKLRYELTKAKAYWWKYAYTNCDTYGFWTKGYRTKATKKDCMTYREQWLRIAEAYEARAAKLKEQM